MPEFIVYPPVVLNDGTSVSTIDAAAAVVAEHTTDNTDANSVGVLHRLQGAGDMAEAADAADAFRAWAGAKKLVAPKV